MQLDRCPSYPSKSEEEREHLELLEKKSPQDLDGCDKRSSSFMLFLVLSFLPFLQVISVADGPLAELPTPPASSKTRLAIQIPGDLEVGVAASLLLPAGSNLFPFILFLRKEKILLSSWYNPSRFPFFYFSLNCFFLS